MSTCLTDWFVAMFLFLIYTVVNKAIKADVSITHSLLMGVSIMVIYRLSRIYDLLKQRQCCKKD